ncbi:hypothetical protein NW754_003199 [Fusarium falciforme]|nr:hypothetical protein NW754_003199 [Fusarium falciforme]KAJ4178639.1 hypothetical protein NW767_014817 [Fusarium falciforme]KAJ4235503.1 hypothetical protein NW757_013478 [Fusarium falciforme]
MKTPFVLLVATLITGIAAGPASELKERFPQLVERKPCYHESDCSWFYGAKCESYCRQWGQDNGVDRMEKCNLLNEKRCCCSKE